MLCKIALCQVQFERFYKTFTRFLQLQQTDAYHAVVQAVEHVYAVASANAQKQHARERHKIIRANAAVQCF